MRLFSRITHKQNNLILTPSPPPPPKPSIKDFKRLTHPSIYLPIFLFTYYPRNSPSKPSASFLFPLTRCIATRSIQNVLLSKHNMRGDATYIWGICINKHVEMECCMLFRWKQVVVVCCFCFINISISISLPHMSSRRSSITLPHVSTSIKQRGCSSSSYHSFRLKVYLLGLNSLYIGICILVVFGIVVTLFK